MGRSGKVHRAIESNHNNKSSQVSRRCRRLRGMVLTSKLHPTQTSQEHSKFSAEPTRVDDGRETGKSLGERCDNALANMTKCKDTPRQYNCQMVPSSSPIIEFRPLFKWVRSLQAIRKLLVDARRSRRLRPHLAKHLNRPPKHCHDGTAALDSPLHFAIVVSIVRDQLHQN